MTRRARARLVGPADRAYIAYSPAFDVTVNAMRVGPSIVSVSYFGHRARAAVEGG